MTDRYRKEVACRGGEKKGKRKEGEEGHIRKDEAHTEEGRLGPEQP